MRLFSFLVLALWVGLAHGASSCDESFAGLAGAQVAELVPAGKLAVGFRRQPDKAAQVWNLIERRQKYFDDYRKTRSITEVEALYRNVAAQVPKEGYTRALSLEELRLILTDGGIGSYYDFAFKNEGARVGHGGNFVFIRCAKCPDEWFTAGQLGSSVVNVRTIPIDHLEIVVPRIPGH